MEIHLILLLLQYLHPHLHWLHHLLRLRHHLLMPFGDHLLGEHHLGDGRMDPLHKKNQILEKQRIFLLLKG